MIDGKRVLAIIPARGGSKGIKRKNIYKLCGEPLISYTIKAAKKTGICDNIVVSTDDEEIAIVSKEYGANVPFIRPKELATDKSKTIDVVMHAINFFAEKNDVYDILLLLQPTQPLRSACSINEAMKFFIEKNISSLLSVSPVINSPLLIRTIDDNGKVTKLLDTNSTVRRQDMPMYFYVNGAIYINSIPCLTIDTSLNDNEYAFILREESVDIDNINDMLYAEYLILKGNRI